MPEGVTASKKSLEQASWYNDDGFGWAIRTPDRILVGKHMDFEKAYEEFMSARSSYNGDALFHLRITTQGNTDLTNCHPFYVGKDELSVVAHNGMLPVADDKTGRSDTRIFAESLLPKRGGITLLNGEQSLNRLEKWADGSKLVFLTANPASKWRYVIVNANDGHWVKDGDDAGVWFSNSSYKYGKPVSMSWSGWGGHFRNYGSYSKWTFGGKEGTTNTAPPAVTESTTDTAMYEDMMYELQHHAYQLAEDLLEQAFGDGKDMDDPTILENGYYNTAEDLLERFSKIYKPYNYHTYMTTCERCGESMYLDHLDLPATHCSHCDCCLYCGGDSPAAGGVSGDCCGWPLGYALAYAPSMTELVLEGGDMYDEKVPTSF
jgi:glutamine amidotransferase